MIFISSERRMRFLISD